VYISLSASVCRVLHCIVWVEINNITAQMPGRCCGQFAIDVVDASYRWPFSVLSSHCFVYARTLLQWLRFPEVCRWCWSSALFTSTEVHCVRGFYRFAAASWSHGITLYVLARANNGRMIYSAISSSRSSPASEIVKCMLVTCWSRHDSRAVSSDHHTDLDTWHNVFTEVVTSQVISQ